jgi:chromosome segregation ATPase
VTESNLAANLLVSEVPHGRFRAFEVEVHETPTFQSVQDHHLQDQASNQELINLRQEVANLKQKLEGQRLQEPSQQPKSSSNPKTIERLKREIKNLKLELSHTESMAQALQRSLYSQLQHNWEQQQHELIASIAKLRAIDHELIVSQANQIQELTQQKLLLEATQQELHASLEETVLELAQNAKALQKMQSSGFNSHRESTKNISLQAVLEQTIRSLQNEYANSQNRVRDLEIQIGELQEQILQQSAQATEYEAAVQHWKEKCVTQQNYALQLISTLERFMEGKDIPKIGESAKVDLPSFLVRQKS